MNIAAGNGKFTILNSLLNESQFGKIQFTLNLNEEGILAEAEETAGEAKGAAAENENAGTDGIFSPSLKWKFSAWKWGGTKTDAESGQVLFTGKAFPGRPLLGIISGQDFEQKARAVFAYSSCVERAASEGVFLPANGAGGVLYCEAAGGNKGGKKKIRLLFLPQEIFEAAAHNAASSDYAEMQALWQDKNLVKKDNASALRWTRAALVYRLLADSLPFPEKDLEARQADILDANYLPLKNRINGIDVEFSDKISAALEAGSAASDTAESKTDIHSGRAKRTSNFDMSFLSALAKESGLLADGSVEGVERKAKMSDEEFKARAKKLFRKKSAAAGASRAFRRNKALFTAGILLIAGSVFLARAVRNDRLRRATTIGLSARETAEVFFSGMHGQSTQQMQAAGKGREVQAQIDAIASVYVSGKMRDAFSQSRGTFTPELWLYRPDAHDKWIFGITDFMLGDSPDTLSEANSRRSAPALRNAGKPLAEKPGAQKSLAVSYYRVHNEGSESPVSAERFSGQVGLTFVKNRWLVTALNTERVSESETPFAEFEADYEAALSEAGESVQAVALLRAKYGWLPTEKAMHAARAEDEASRARFGLLDKS